MSDAELRPLTLDGNAVRSVDRAALLLLALGEGPPVAGVTELARRLGLHKSTVSRLLGTLERRGLVEQVRESGKYRLGIVFVRLADQAERSLDLASLIGPELARLTEMVHEPASLVVLDGRSVVVLASAGGGTGAGLTSSAPAGFPQQASRVGAAHASAAGKVLLAARPEREILALARSGLRSFSDRTITGLEPLLEDLARTRRRGWGTSIGELDAGRNAVAAPVIGPRGDVLAAVEVAGPATRLTPTRMLEVGPIVVSSARAASMHLGAPAGNHADPEEMNGHAAGA